MLSNKFFVSNTLIIIIDVGVEIELEMWLITVNAWVNKGDLAFSCRYRLVSPIIT